MERKPTKKNQGISALLPCTAGYRLPAFFTPFLMIGEVALEVMIPLLMAALVDGGLYHEETYQLKELLSLLPIGNNLQFVLWTGGLMVLASLLSLTFGALAARTSAVASMGFAKNLRHALFERIQSFGCFTLGKAEGPAQSFVVFKSCFFLCRHTLLPLHRGRIAQKGREAPSNRRHRPPRDSSGLKSC